MTHQHRYQIYKDGVLAAKPGFRSEMAAQLWLMMTAKIYNLSGRFAIVDTKTQNETLPTTTIARR